MSNDWYLPHKNVPAGSAERPGNFWPQRTHRAALLSALALVALAAAEISATESSYTNVVLIMTDNQGAWTLGRYGNPDMLTPNMNRLAASSMLLTRAFSSNAVRSPRGATYLTRLLPSHHGVHFYLHRDEPQMGPNEYCTISEFCTLPKYHLAGGYRCGLVGKWHPGANLTPQESFSYWITMPHGATATFYNAEVIEDGKVRIEPTYLTEFWTRHAVRFIRKNRTRPFFLFLAYNSPYGLGPMLTRGARNRFYYYYASKELLSFPHAQMHPWLFNNKQYLNQLGAVRRYAAEVSAIDDGAGTVLQTLAASGLERRTLVIFSADRGWAGGQNGIWGMGDRTRPLGAFDSMMHIPLIFRHPGRIPSGKRADIPVSNYDLMPTVLSYLGLGEFEYSNHNSPGRDLSPTLLDEQRDLENCVYYEMEIVRAIRTDKAKCMHRYPNGPFELYDLQVDSFDKLNLYGQPSIGNYGKSSRASSSFLDTYADSNDDLYCGGRSKAGLLSRLEVR